MGVAPSEKENRLVASPASRGQPDGLALNVAHMPNAIPVTLRLRVHAFV